MDVLGTDDPEVVQTYVCDWKSYNDLAYKVAEHGYLMTMSPEDSLRVYDENRSSAWEQNGSIFIDSHVDEWAHDSQDLYQKGCIGNTMMWSEDWMDGFNGGVFCYFGPTWLYEYVMYGSVADQGGWAVCQGPEPFYWGGTWIAVANGTDNGALAADIIRKMTIDQDVMREIAQQDGDFVNSMTVMKEMEQDRAWYSSVLGGQNAVSILSENASALRFNYVTSYDYDCYWDFDQSMTDFVL